MKFSNAPNMSFNAIHENEILAKISEFTVYMYLDTVQSLYNAMFGLTLGSIGMDCVIRESCYKGTILQKNYRKIIFYGHFPIIPM